MLTPPTFIDMIYTKEDGGLTANALLYNDQQSLVINTLVGFFNRAVPFPVYTTTQVTNLNLASDASIVVGSVWFNSTLAKLQVKTAAATIQTITST